LEKKWIKILVSEVGDFGEIPEIDSGQIIPSEISQQIFQPFFTTKDIGKSARIGLSISLGIVQSFSGRL
jgi:C4-dicarboxylate-specific signal transduction histidine kinase